MKTTGGRFRSIAWIYAFTGGISLACEVIALRLLRLELGSTTYAVTAVLCTFMGGMAIGSALAAALADRSRRPLRTYALLTLGVSACFLLLPHALAVARPFCLALCGWTACSAPGLLVAPFVVSSLVLLIPCIMMGATFPFVVRAVSSRSGNGERIALLYGVNALGAAAGAIAGGFALLPRLGVSASLSFVCLAGATAALLTIALDRAQGSKPVEVSAEPATGAGGNTARGRGGFPVVVSIACAASGAAAMIYELTWTRALSAMIGSSTYAFSLMLAAFIMGLSMGGLAAKRFVGRLLNPAPALAAALAGVGASAMAVIPLFNSLPVWFLHLVAPRVTSFAAVQAVSLLMIFLIMLVPTVLMGLAFPLAARAFLDRGISAGRGAGLISAVNTAGNVAGALAGGLLLLPAIGLQNSLCAGVGLNVASACILLAGTRAVRRRFILSAGLALVTAAAMLAAPRWSVSSMTFGPLIRAVRHSGPGDTPPTALSDGVRILYHREGLGSGITVKETPTGERVLFVGGKPDASTAGDLPTQTMLAHLPLLMHPEPKDMLVIGLASGISLGSAGRHPLKSLDCVEIEPRMKEACRYFDSFNHRILDDPRVRLIVADGRTYLDISPSQYDVIVSQPTNPWICGMGDLFTVEFFRKCRARLRSGGMACVWVDSYSLSEDAFRSVAASFASVFPNVQMWSFLRSDYILVGSDAPIEAPVGRIADRLHGSVAGDIGRVIRPSVPDLMANFVSGTAGVSMLGRNARIHTDDNAYIEFSAPRSMLNASARLGVFSAVESVRDAGFGFLRGSPGTEGVLAECSAMSQSRGLVMRAAIQNENGDKAGCAASLRQAAALNPEDSFLQRLVRARLRRGASFLRDKRPDEACAEYRGLLDLVPSDARALHGLGCSLEARGLGEEAWRSFAAAVEAAPSNASFRATLADSSYRLRKIPEALAGYRVALALEPDSPAVLNNCAWLLASAADPSLRDVGEAAGMAERACELTGWRDEHVVETLARIYLIAARYDDAVQAWDTAAAAAGAEEKSRLAGRQGAYVEAIRRIRAEKPR